MRQVRDYDQAFSELDRDHESGKLGDAQYEMYKTRLLAEMQANQRVKHSPGVTFLIWFAVAVACYFLYRVLIYSISVANQTWTP